VKAQVERSAQGSPDVTELASRPILITIAGLQKQFTTHSGETVTALSNVNLSVGENEFISVVGPSGCGKTTLMRILAGLEVASAGQLKLEGSEISGPRSNVGVVFQQATLLPWNSVLTNVLLPAHLKNDKSEATIKRAKHLLEFMGLGGFDHKYPFELSGGMQQRVAICRALMRDPKVLLMDEPFGALDAMTREAMNLELMRVWSEEKKTVIFITHSIPEAVLLSDRVVVMSPRPGRISEIVSIDIDRPRNLECMGTPRFGELCDHIRSIFGSRAPTMAAL
jgi:NitT/TauT family transport system ATP-binding protein